MEEDGSNFDKFLGAFGAQTNLEKRARAERFAAMKPGDGRRNRKGDRHHQLNVRVNDATKSVVDELVTQLTARDGREWSKTDVVEAALSSLAKQVRGEAAA